MTIAHIADFSAFNWRDYIMVAGFSDARKAEMETLLDAIVATGADGEALIRQAYDTQLAVRKQLLGGEPTDPKIEITPTSIEAYAMRGSTALADPLSGKIFFPAERENHVVLLRENDSSPYHRAHEVQILLDEMAGMASHQAAIAGLKKIKSIQANQETKNAYYDTLLNQIILLDPEPSIQDILQKKYAAKETVTAAEEATLASRKTNYANILARLDPETKNRIFSGDLSTVKPFANREQDYFKVFSEDLRTLSTHLQTLPTISENAHGNTFTPEALLRALTIPPSEEVFVQSIAIEQVNDRLVDTFVTAHFPNLTPRGDYVRDMQVLTSEDAAAFTECALPAYPEIIMPERQEKMNPEIGELLRILNDEDPATYPTQSFAEIERNFPQMPLACSQLAAPPPPPPREIELPFNGLERLNRYPVDTEASPDNPSCLVGAKPQNNKCR